MDHLMNILPSQAKRLRNVLASDDSEAKLLLVALLDDIIRGAATTRDLGFLDGSDTEDERIADKLKMISRLSSHLTVYNERPYELEEQINDFYTFPDARRVAADLRVHDITGTAGPFILLAVVTDQEGRAEGEFPGHYTLPFDVIAAIGIRAFEWYRGVIEGLASRPGRTRGIGTEDIRSYIKVSIRDSYNQLESDALDVEYYIAMSFLRAKLGVKPPIVDI
jgi:hypothetical protein